MIKDHIETLLRKALSTLQAENNIPSITDLPIYIDATKDKQFGDFVSNLALTLAKPTQRKPRELAELLVAALPTSTYVDKVAIAGPGFINFYLTQHAYYHVIPDILEKKENYATTNYGKGKKIIVEFVSSNPTGPLHVGHGRHAAFGMVISNLLKMSGYNVHREYYVNDAGRQMDILAVSVWLRYLELMGEKICFPTNAYQGNYVNDIAHLLQTKQFVHFEKDPLDSALKTLPPDAPEGDKEIHIDAWIALARNLLGEKFQLILKEALDYILKDIKEDLTEFGVTFDEWFYESKLVKENIVNKKISQLEKTGRCYEREGALWFRSTDFGDEKDRVLRRSNGQNTYFMNDLAYHIDKVDRKFDAAIDIFGSDHHGYIPRMKAGLEASGIAPDKLTYLLVQFVTLYRGKEQVQMSTRSGSFVTLRELRNEVGNDAARFFYVLRKHEQHMDFDLDLAKSQSNENPVYYIQYAHARICSVFRQLAEKNFSYDEKIGLEQVALLSEDLELALLTLLSRYHETIQNAALNLEAHLLPHYLRDLANGFHVYYNSCQFLVEESNLRNARLTLIKATQQILKNGLTILGVSAPERM